MNCVCPGELGRVTHEGPLTSTGLPESALLLDMGEYEWRGSDGSHHHSARHDRQETGKTAEEDDDKSSSLSTTSSSSKMFLTDYRSGFRLYQVGRSGTIYSCDLSNAHARMCMFDTRISWFRKMSLLAPPCFHVRPGPVSGLDSTRAVLREHGSIEGARLASDRQALLRRPWLVDLDVCVVVNVRPPPESDPIN